LGQSQKTNRSKLLTLILPYPHTSMSYMLDNTLFNLVFHILTNPPQKPQKHFILFLTAP